MADNKTLETGENTEAVRVETVQEQVDAQVAPPREPEADKVDVHEVRVATDVVITDPSSPLAVQVPDAGKGSVDLPIHQLDAPSPEQVLSGDEPAEEQAYVEDPQGPAQEEENNS